MQPLFIFTHVFLQEEGVWGGGVRSRVDAYCIYTKIKNEKKLSFDFVECTHIYIGLVGNEYTYAYVIFV